jgi:hypothetical protein
MTDDIQQPDDSVPARIPSDEEPNTTELNHLIRKLTAEQNEARAQSVYGGMTEADARKYDERRERISRLTQRLLREKNN